MGSVGSLGGEIGTRFQHCYSIFRIRLVKFALAYQNFRNTCST